MSKIAVIYKSIYGFTKTYASWIAGELSADLLETDQVKAADLQKYDTIIYGGGLYAGGVSGISLLSKNFDALNGKALYLFTVGAADVSDVENITSIRNSLTRSLTPQMLEKMKIYHLRGGLSYSKMSFIHKTMMGMKRRSVLKKPVLSGEDHVFLDTYDHDVTFVDKNMIADLVADVRQGA